MNESTKQSNSEKPTGNASLALPIHKKIWWLCMAGGAGFWALALILWAQQGIDQAGLFYFDPARVSGAPIVVFSKWLSGNGMAAITVIFVLYLLASKVIKWLDASPTIYPFTFCSYGLSGIAGDLLKEVFARPRPVMTFGSEIFVWSQSVTPAIPSGHATKSIALILPFVLLVPSSNWVHKTIKVVITLTAAGVCLSRTVLGAHYLSDVVAGVGMALIGLPFSILFANMILKRIPREKLPFLSWVWGLHLVFLVWDFKAL